VDEVEDAAAERAGQVFAEHLRAGPRAAFGLVTGA
jgi:hypothetical protein